MIKKIIRINGKKSINAEENYVSTAPNEPNFLKIGAPPRFNSLCMTFASTRRAWLNMFRYTELQAYRTPGREELLP